MYFISIPFPGNDESLDCLLFYNSLVSYYILLRKFKNIFTWFFFMRKIKRLNLFKDWISLNLFKRLKGNNIINFKYNKKINVSYYLNLQNHLLLGMLYYFSKNDKFGYLIEDYNIFYKDIKIINSSDLVGYNFYFSLFNGKLLLLKMQRLYWIRYHLLNEKNLRDVNFLDLLILSILFKKKILSSSYNN